jgi:serine/threonine-protein kinase
MLGHVYLRRYEILRLLGEGGMGRAYLARDMQQDEPVVVKLMHEHIAANPRFRERFQREIESMARFRHPHAVGFLAADSEDPHGPCLVMEYVPGVSLDKLLAHHGRFSPMRLRRMLGQLCEVLQAAHDQGIIHRDLKPSNLLVIDPDTPFEKLKVMDFGLAQAVDRPLPVPVDPGGGEATEYAVGTAGYMSPEQVRGEPVDSRSDLYSVGVLVYQLLTGRLPFTGSTMDILLSQATGELPTFASLGLAKRIPSTVESVVRSCLAAAAADRPSCARDLAARYESALAQAYEPRREIRPPDPPPPLDRQPVVEVPADATVFQIAALMPEPVARSQLRGFVAAVGGQLQTNTPSLLRLSVAERPNGSWSSGPLAWLGFGRGGAPSTAIDVELRLRKKALNQKDLLEIMVLMRPVGGGPLPATPTWHKRCNQIFSTLQAYLGARVPPA